jgi:hypothetical protein
VKQPTALAAKGRLVEEWIDLHFFRPLGYGIARRLVPLKRVTPDQVTLASLLIGLAAGHLLYYESVTLNVLGVVLFVVSDIFDSADGQLARMRGTSTRFGRILDGVSDNLRFVNLYLHLVFRLMGAGWGWEVLGLAALAGLSHSFQSAAVDFIRQAYLYLGAGTGSELDLPEALEPAPRGTSLGRRLGIWFYSDYVRRQAWLFPRTADLVRAAGRDVSEPLRAAYDSRLATLVPRCALIGQNLRFLLLALTAVPGWPAGFFWITVGPLNLVLLGLVMAQERQARALLHAEPQVVSSHVSVA